MIRHFPMDSTVSAILIGSTFLVFLTLVALGLRCWGRYYNGTKLYWDDYLAILSSAQGVAILVIQGMWSTMGEGRPSTAVNRHNTVMTKMLLMILELLYATCTANIKFSVLFFYLRIFSVQVSSSLGKLVQCALSFVTLWTVGNVLQVFLICTPFEASYDDQFAGACGNRIASYIGIGAFNVVADFFIMSLPISVIWSLQIDRSSKIGLTIVFFLGFMSVQSISQRHRHLTHPHDLSAPRSRSWQPDRINGLASVLDDPRSAYINSLHQCADPRVRFAYFCPFLG